MPHSTLTTRTEIGGQQVDVAPLETIDYALLAARDPVETERLLLAAQLPGFFYLDLRNEPTREFKKELHNVYTISEQYFKPNEQQVMFEINRDKTINNSLEYPPILADHKKELEKFSTLCHSVNKSVLSSLSDALKLEGPHRFEMRHCDDRPSDTALNLIYSPAKKRLADAPDTTHTDTGTLTSLFCDRWGIQIEHPETKSWAFVEPKAGCALVNVADSLQALSGDKLHSCRHRHTQPVDGFQPRYFLVAYLRPQKDEQ